MWSHCVLLHSGLELSREGVGPARPCVAPRGLRPGPGMQLVVVFAGRVQSFTLPHSERLPLWNLAVVQPEGGMLAVLREGVSSVSRQRSALVATGRLWSISIRSKRKD